MKTLYDSTLDPFDASSDSDVSDLEKSLSGDHGDRIRAIFREHPSVKASVDAGTLRVWIDDAGTERWALVSKRISKALHHIPIDDGNAAKASPAVRLPGFTKGQVDARVRLALINHAIADGDVPSGCGI